MRYILIICFFIGCTNTVFAQQDAKQLYESAKILMRQAEYETATTILLKAIQQDSVNLEMQKDLAFLYLLQKAYPNAIQTARPLIDRADADAQSFQILGMAYKATGAYTECGTLYKYALLKFPTSGVIYNDYGELLAMQQQLPQAIVIWEKGIVSDPNYSSNYYNATMYYALNKQWMRAALYGEYFVNLESFTTRTNLIKEKLVKAYQGLLQPSSLQNTVAASAFEKSFLTALLKKEISGSKTAVSIESIIAARSNFLLEWTKESSTQYPFRIIDHWNQLSKEGMFGAYNQWIFGEAMNAANYQSWVNAHTKEVADFKQFQQSRVFKVPLNQNYNNN